MVVNLRIIPFQQKVVHRQNLVMRMQSVFVQLINPMIMTAIVTFVRMEHRAEQMKRVVPVLRISRYWIVQQTAVKRVLIKVVRKRWKKTERMRLVV